jgi:hypothetical protein
MFPLAEWGKAKLNQAITNFLFSFKTIPFFAGSAFLFVQKPV